MNFLPIRRYALAHHGLITVAQAAYLGMSRNTFYSATSGGHLELVHPLVARLPNVVPTQEQRILAAVLACGPAAMASHRSGVHLWTPTPVLAGKQGWTRADPAPVESVDVIVPRAHRGPAMDGVSVHRPRDLGDLRPVVRQQILVTNPLRTLLDVGAVAPAQVSDAFERMVIAGFVSPLAVRAVLDRHQQRGRHGTVALRAVLDAWTMNAKPPDSVLEERLNALLIAHRLPSATFHPIICGFEVDFLITGSTIVIECDGYEFHKRDRAVFESDRDRDAVLAAAGFVVVRRTWRQITRQPANTASRIRAVIARHAPWLGSSTGFSAA